MVAPPAEMVAIAFAAIHAIVLFATDVLSFQKFKKTLPSLIVPLPSPAWPEGEKPYPIHGKICIVFFSKPLNY